ncbi:release factor glutamine methyltransferase [Williamsia limnetica]|uniref:Release factor glutamine methyltransferase n=1 Tax=Williamsia limnetica TaxID=882452 RepID=A0A318REV9_WILLI|nr:HemK2/MTQ2 family protein methyltransferase [Williamsia limnetica]PYE14938.1 release factor glutamine methyltransferase [Williamsia limnetica]
MAAAQSVPTVLESQTSDPVDDVLDVYQSIRVPAGVYAPQEDSLLLLTALAERDLVTGRRVLDLCTGSGVLAVGAAVLGAARVSAYDISPRAVLATRANATAAGVIVEAHKGSLDEAVEAGPYDVVVSNPPYVPADTLSDSTVGLTRTWHGGRDGRSLLDPLCVMAPDLLAPGGTMLLVQSEFSDVDRSLIGLRAGGLRAEVVAREKIPFGPVLMENARWLEILGRLEPGRREEELVVIRADKDLGVRR